jgi:hypothetical protein
MEHDKKVNPKLGWTLGELAHSLSVSVPFLRLEIKRGKLRAAHLGRRELSCLMQKCVDIWRRRTIARLERSEDRSTRL